MFLLWSYSIHLFSFFKYFLLNSFNLFIYISTFLLLLFNLFLKFLNIIRC